MNAYRLFVLLALQSVVLMLPVTATYGQSQQWQIEEHRRRVRIHQWQVEQRIKQQQREMDKRRKQFERERAERQSNRSSNSSRSTNSSRNVVNVTPSAAEYVFRDGQSLAYAVKVNATDPKSKRYWAGVVVLHTTKPTPTRGDGSTYGSAQLKVWGHLEGHTLIGDKMKRTKDEDIVFPEKMPFGTTGVGDYSKPSGKHRLPCHMSLCFRVMNGIFPKAPLFETNETKEYPKSFLVQTMYGTGGSHTNVNGTLRVKQRTRGSRLSIDEQFKSEEGSQHQIAYTVKRSGAFSSGMLEQARTDFDIEWQGNHHVDISVNRIPVQQVYNAFPAARP